MARIIKTVRVPGRMRRARTDADILSVIRLALEMAYGDGVHDLEVRCERGAVTLRGEVDRIDDIAAYERVAREVPGVLDLDNLLRLRLVGRGAQHTVSA